MKPFFILFISVLLFSCEKKVIEDPPELKPEIYCGTDWSLNCLDSKWVVNLSPPAQITPNLSGVNGMNSLLLYNPHDSVEQNTPLIVMKSVIKNIKPNSSYKISFYSKIKGFPDYSNNLGFEGYVLGNLNGGGGLYNTIYYGSQPGVYHEKDWSQHSFIIIGKDEPTVNFVLYTAYDSTWISNLVINEI